MRFAALLMALFLPACTVVGHERVRDWPDLAIVEHRVPHAQMRDRCVRYAPPGISPEACAEYDLAGGECRIWYSADFPPPPAVIEHERLHCRGYDHLGAKTMQRALEAHRDREAAKRKTTVENRAGPA